MNVNYVHVHVSNQLCDTDYPSSNDRAYYECLEQTYCMISVSHSAVISLLLLQQWKQIKFCCEYWQKLIINGKKTEYFWKLVLAVGCGCNTECERVTPGWFSCDFVSLWAARRLYHSNMFVHNLFILIFNMWQPWLLYLNFSTLKGKKKHNPRPFVSSHEIQQQNQPYDLKYPSNNTHSYYKDVYNRYTVLCIDIINIFVALPDSNGNRLDFWLVENK